MISKLQVAFVLGFKTAQQVHGVSQPGKQTLTDAVFRILEQVASGQFTLIHTPEEIIADLPDPPPDLAAESPETVKKLQEDLAARMPEMIRQAMRDQREVAAELLKVMK